MRCLRAVFLTVGSFTLLGGPSPCLAQPVPPVRQLLKDMSEAVVTIVALDSDGTPLISGSGFAVARDGLIVSSYPLVKQARQIRVLDDAGRELDKPSVVTFDQEAGYVILRIDQAGLEPIRLGDSDRARVGDEVLAVGTPFGFERTFLKGHISARSEKGESPKLVTTLPSSPGDNGGPLCNRMGEVIGLTIADGLRNSSRVLPINAVRHALEGFETKD